MTTRSYGQYCGLARALDVVGDRWNLLIVRQLLAAPARYRELLDGLPGIATNLLANRLRDLEAVGVIQRQLAPDSNAVIYALTPWGAELREPIESLIRWSAPLMVRGPDGDPFRIEWFVVALPALLNGRVSTDHPSTVGIAVEGALVQATVTSSGVTVGLHDGRRLDAIVHADPMIVLGLAAGMLALDDVSGLVELDGDPKAVQTLFGAGRVQSSR